MSCPICSKPTHKDFRPFCSSRCAEIDLGRWLNGSYAIPVTDEDPGEKDAGISPDGHRPDRAH